MGQEYLYKLGQNYGLLPPQNFNPFVQPLYLPYHNAQGELIINHMSAGKQHNWTPKNSMAPPMYYNNVVSTLAPRRRRPRNARARHPTSPSTGKPGSPAGAAITEPVLPQVLPNSEETELDLVLEGPNSPSGNPRGVLRNADVATTIISQLEVCNHVQRSRIIAWLQPVMLNLTLSENGCRVIQKALEVAGGEDRTSLVEILHGLVLDLVESPYGNYVLQKSIEVMPPNQLQFVLDELSVFEGGWVGLAKHRFGCRVAQRLLEHAPEDMIYPLAEAIAGEAEVLARHQFANYVVQHILEYGCQTHRTQVIKAMIHGDIIMLAQHRVASNVVERAL